MIELLGQFIHNKTNLGLHWQSEEIKVMYVNLAKYQSLDGSGRDTYIYSIQNKNQRVNAESDKINRVYEFWGSVAQREGRSAIPNKSLLLTDSQRRAMRITSSKCIDSGLTSNIWSQSATKSMEDQFGQLEFNSNIPVSNTVLMESIHSGLISLTNLMFRAIVVMYHKNIRHYVHQASKLVGILKQRTIPHRNYLFLFQCLLLCFLLLLVRNQQQLVH